MGEKEQQIRRLCHGKHNSFIDFSFTSEKSTSNSVTLVHLNALFEKIADRKVMGITAKKLYKLILKAEVSKHKLRYYQYKLDITGEEAQNVLEDCSDTKRVISRGPFMSLFKDEPIKFVNALEVAARPMFKRKRREVTLSNSKASIQSKVASVKTEPLKVLHHEDVNSRGGKSPKHRKIEDKTGMIIVAEVDHDEISTVSVSPTGEESVNSYNSFSSASSQSQTSTIKKRQTSSRSSSSRKSARKSSRKKKRSDTLRSVKSIGDESKDCSEAKTLFSENSNASATVVNSDTSSSHIRNHSCHDIGSIDVHSLMNGMPFPNPNPHMVLTSYQQNGVQNVYKQPFMHQQPLLFHGGFVSTRIPYHNSLTYHHMSSVQNLFYPSPIHFSYGNSCKSKIPHEIEYEECFLFKNVAKFLKNIFGFFSKPSGKIDSSFQSCDFSDVKRKRAVSRLYDCGKLENPDESLNDIYSDNIQRVLSYKLKIDDGEQTNRPRVYSAPEQKFSRQNVMAKAETEVQTRLSNISISERPVNSVTSNLNSFGKCSDTFHGDNKFLKGTKPERPRNLKETITEKKMKQSDVNLVLQEFHPNSMSKSSRYNSEAVNCRPSAVPPLLKRGSSLMSSEAVQSKQIGASMHHYR